jgi:hypothetical protein
MPGRKQDDPLALVPTIADDSDVPDLDGPDDEEDEEELVAKPRAHKMAQATKGKSIDFNDEFQFILVRERSVWVANIFVVVVLGRSRREENAKGQGDH